MFVVGGRAGLVFHFCSCLSRSTPLFFESVALLSDRSCRSDLCTEHSQSFLCKHVCDAEVERDCIEARPSQQKLSQARFDTYFFFFPVNCQKYHLSRLVQLIRSR